MAVTMGAMTQGQLDKYLKGWAQRSLEVIDLDMQTVSPLDKAFPIKTTEIPRIEFFTTHGVPGQLDVALDTPPVTSRWSYTRVTKDMKIQKFSYKILDTTRAMVYIDEMAADGTDMALTYFGQVHTYKLITEIKAKYGNTGAAGAYWNAAGQNCEGNIMTAIEKIMSKTGTNPESTTYGVIFPSEVMSGVNQLDLLHNVQQNLKDYLKDAWNINWYPYTPAMDADGNEYIDIEQKTSSDALGSDALVFIEGAKTLRAAQYKPPASVPMSETTRLHDEGWITTLRHSYECLAVPKFNATSTPHIYKITGVSA
jgi:hypothetical protein